MIAAGGILLLALNLVAQSTPGDIPAQSFEQISRAAEQARDANRDDDAIRLFRQGLKLNPEWKEGLWYLGTLLYDRESVA